MKNLPSEIEVFRDKKWRREEVLRIENALAAEQMIENLGFCLGLTDSRTDLPSLYVAVCGRREVHAPKNVQKDIEMSQAWVLKDEIMRRGKVYYAKLNKARSMFVAPRMVPFFHAIWGIPKSNEKELLSENAQVVLKILRKEWEMATADLRSEGNFSEKKFLTKAIDELQSKMKVVPFEVLYQPKFTYIWTLAEARFPSELKQKIPREIAVREIARNFLQTMGMSRIGELAKTFSLSRKEAGKANHELVDEGFAERIEHGVYELAELKKLQTP